MGSKFRASFISVHYRYYNHNWLQLKRWYDLIKFSLYFTDKKLITGGLEIDSGFYRTLGSLSEIS